MNLPLKSVLITGSSRGIGKSIAIELSRNSYSVVLHGRTDTKHLNSVGKEIAENGGVARQVVFDVNDRNHAKESLEKDIAKNGVYYGVVLNAGVSRDNAFPFMQDEDWDDVLSTNLDSFYNVLKPLIEPMIVAKQGGRIIVMSSVSGILGNRGQVNYCAAKAGLIGAARALGLELAKKSITVNCVAPGLIETDMTSQLNQDKIIPLIPMRRKGRVEEVSGVVSFLMSEQAAYITRQTVSVDGGMS
jgi:3-oxoacyl-[acyl-carrier protein] reductase